jgi:hypothetical protein
MIVRGGLACLGCLVVVLGASPARAQSAPQLKVQVDEDTVGVGDVLHLELTAQSADGMPSDPTPGATPGFVLRGQSSSPSQTHMIINGVRSDRYGLTVDWALQAQRTGSFRIGPPTIVLGGSRYSGQPISVRVVPAGHAPHRAPSPMQPPQSPFGFSPFDPWKGLFPGFDQPPSQPPQLPTVRDPSLALAVPRGAYFFLHATVDKTSAVVGEQVTFSLYRYLDRTAGRSVELDEADVHEPAVADFLKRPIMREDQDALLEGEVTIGDHVWQVVREKRWALFPLRSGDLEIGPESVTVVSPRAAAGKRASETFRVTVSEPPLAGRPPGYALGDVGRFVLSAQVTPRDIDQGGAVGVHVEISGTGNVPATMATPGRTGVEWLVPEVHEELGPVANGGFGGKRTFDYVVRVDRSGEVDLGEIAVPFWDPEQKAYTVARATLGVVHARPSARAGGGAPPPEEPLPGLPQPRDAVEGSRAPKAHLGDSPIFWLAGIASWPLAFGVAVVGRAAGRRARDAWRVRRTSPGTRLRERVHAATAACGGSDGRTADAAIARALEAAAVAHAGVSVRGAVGNEVIERLERAGVRREAAERIADLLRECEAARFAPDAADVVAARARWMRAQGAIRELERRA